MRSAAMEVGGVSVGALRVSFTGDLGWELHCEERDQIQLYEALIVAGREVGAGPVGSRALTSLRVEKGYGSWGREYSPEYRPQEVGLERLVKPAKDFLNKAAWQAVAEAPARERLIMIEVDAEAASASDADASGGEPIFLPDGTPAGQVTTGAYGHGAGASLALGFLKDGVAGPGDRVSVAILGRDHPATVLERPPFDPEGTRLRA